MPNKHHSGVTRRTMTVQELIDTLEEIDGEDRDKPILFACDYGDYHHTTQVLAFTGLKYGGPAKIEESGYSQSGWALSSEKDQDEDDDEDNIVPSEVEERDEGPTAFILE